MHVHIVGAGIAGATLARCLKQQGISATLFDKASPPALNAHNLLVQSVIYQHILRRTDISNAALTQVFLEQDLTDPRENRSVHRGKFERLLREGLHIKWNYEVQDIKNDSKSKKITLSFTNGHTLETDFLVAADGEHSVVRNLLTTSKLSILPYVAYHGCRQLSRADFEQTYRPYLTSKIDRIGHNCNVPTEKSQLKLVVNDSTVLHIAFIPDDKQGSVLMRYTYSRPAYQHSLIDPLFRPTRDKKDSSLIPPELFDELAALPELSQPFKDAFDPTQARDDKILHWLLRRSLLTLDDMVGLAEKKVAFIGNAAHAEPIVGRYGASAAMMDAVGLADWIGQYGLDDLADWYKSMQKYWAKHHTPLEDHMKRYHSPPDHSKVRL